MKANIHPKWYPQAKVTCACGNTFEVGATFPEITVGVCYLCHPFYTGQMKYLDTAGRVEAFKKRKTASSNTKISKKEKRRLKKVRKIEEERNLPDTLTELRKGAKSKAKKS